MEVNQYLMEIFFLTDLLLVFPLASLTNAISGYISLNKSVAVCNGTKNPPIVFPIISFAIVSRLSPDALTPEILSINLSTKNKPVPALVPAKTEAIPLRSKSLKFLRLLLMVSATNKYAAKGIFNGLVSIVLLPILNSYHFSPA